MADKTDSASATADVINHAIDKASDGLSQVATALSKAAPKAWEVAVHGVYAQGAASITVAALCLLGWLIFWSLGIWGILRCRRTEEKSVDGSPWLFLIIPAGFIGIVFLIAAGANGLNSDAWARIYSPDGYLAQQIITAAVSK